MKILGKRLLALSIGLTLLLSTLAGCGTNSNTDTSASTELNASTTSASTVSTETIDPLGKYETPITITAVKRTLQGNIFIDGMNEEDNTWTRLYKDYGINVKYLWMADASQYDERLNVSVASGDIPDVFVARGSHLAVLNKSDAVQDMKASFEKYASPEVKGIFNTPDGEAALKAGTIDGQLKFMPNSYWLANDYMEPFFIRKDWLQKVGLTAPKTADEFLKVCDAFVNNDPDGNGKKDTYALGIAGKDNLIKDWGGLRGIFEMYHSQPGTWFDGSLFFEKDSSGAVIWSGSKPGVKQALTQLQDMYKKGWISKDFATMDSGGKLAQDLVAGKCGIFLGAYWNALWPLPDLKKKDPKSDWIAVWPPSIDDKTVDLYSYMPVNTWYVVSQNCKNPEAIIKMMNLYQKYSLEDPDKYFTQNKDNAGVGGLNAVCALGDPNQNKNQYAQYNAAINGDESKVEAKYKATWESIKKYIADPSKAESTDWGNYRTWVAEEYSPVWLAYDYVKPEMVLRNAYYTVMSDNYTSKVVSYKKMAEETITKIIMGASPVSEWDNMITQWNKLGGDEILKEVQDYQSK